MIMAALVHIECCSTDFLLNEETSFSKLSFENKKHVIQSGRALPDMTINCKRRDGFFKHFLKSFYDKYTWMTGSCKLNKMYCFPCLLFSDSTSVWSSTGFIDINNLGNSAKKHIQTEKHIRSCLLLHEFGNSLLTLNVFEKKQEIGACINRMQRPNSSFNVCFNHGPGYHPVSMPGHMQFNPCFAPSPSFYQQPGYGPPPHAPMQRQPNCFMPASELRKISFNNGYQQGKPY